MLATCHVHINASCLRLLPVQVMPALNISEYVDASTTYEAWLCTLV